VCVFDALWLAVFRFVHAMQAITRISMWAGRMFFYVVLYALAKLTMVASPCIYQDINIGV
jgi:fumarate reductase subunit D